MSDSTELRSTRRERRRRRQGGLRKRPSDIAALLPHILTTGNLAAGFYAIAKASTGDPERASWAILVAGIFDVLDGRAARLTHSESRFGVEYDSIADTVSFGVAPAMIAFHAGHFAELGWAGWVMAFLYTACASLRLARYNVVAGRYRGRFDGLPSPAGGGMIVATVWFIGFLREAGIEISVPALLPAICVALLGLLMVSPIPYRSSRDVRIGGSYRNTVTVVVTSIALIALPQVSFFIVGVLYVLSGPFGLYWRKRTGRPLERVVPEGEEPAVSGAQSGGAFGSTLSGEEAGEVPDG